MAAKPQNLRRYIVMSADGFQAPLNEATFTLSNATVALAARAEAVIPAPQMRVLDSIGENGPKLVEMPAEGELSLRLSMPGIKIVPEVFYERQWERFRAEQRPAPARGTAKVSKKAIRGRGMTEAAAVPASVAGFDITITDSATGKPVAGAQIIAFSNFIAREGANAQTNASGRATLKGLTPGRKLERAYIYGPMNYWGFYAADTTGAALSNIKLDPINVKDPSLLLTQLYGSLPLATGQGVTIGIIDSGVDGTHPDLPNVTGGLNCVGDETRFDFAALANWRPARTNGQHGTHVAGIVAGRGATSGFRGMAPGASLRSYRVFPDNGGFASNFDIVKAINTAVFDKCDIINLSLGGVAKDEFARFAIDFAVAAGVVVVAAAGNNSRQPVLFPAALPECVAVSAMGRIGSFPKQSIGASAIATPKSATSPKDFVADFSNFGAEVDVIGAGVEIVSTLPGQGYGALSGTSMASPAVAGFCAHLLSTHADVRKKIGADRSRALKDLLYASCKPESFGRDFEGFGLPRAPDGQL